MKLNDKFISFFSWLNKYAGSIGVIISLLIFIVPTSISVYNYFEIRTKEIQLERFKIYHNLIRDLVRPHVQDNKIYIDRQIAVVYELGNFPEYYELTTRILNGLKESWGVRPDSTRLINEINITLKIIEKSKKT